MGRKFLFSCSFSRKKALCSNALCLVSPSPNCCYVPPLCAFYIFISHIEWLKGMEQRNLPHNHDNSVELDADNIEHPHANLERCNGVDTHRPAFVSPSASSYSNDRSRVPSPLLLLHNRQRPQCLRVSIISMNVLVHLQSLLTSISWFSQVDASPGPLEQYQNDLEKTADSLESKCSMVFLDYLNKMTA